MSGKGFKFVGKTKQVEKAPEALRGLSATEGTDIKASPITTGLRKTLQKPAIEGMFSRKPVTVASKPKAPIAVTT